MYTDIALPEPVTLVAGLILVFLGLVAALFSQTTALGEASRAEPHSR